MQHHREIKLCFLASRGGYHVLAALRPTPMSSLAFIFAQN